MRNQIVNLNQDILNWVNQCNESRENIKIKDNNLKEKNKIINNYEKEIVDLKEYIIKIKKESLASENARRNSDKEFINIKN